VLLRDLQLAQSADALLKQCFLQKLRLSVLLGGLLFEKLLQVLLPVHVLFLKFALDPLLKIIQLLFLALFLRHFLLVAILGFLTLYLRKFLLDFIEGGWLLVSFFDH